MSQHEVTNPESSPSPGDEVIGGGDPSSRVRPRWFSIGKLVLAFCMLLGRLEIYSLLILLLPTFWQRR